VASQPSVSMDTRDDAPDVLRACRPAHRVQNLAHQVLVGEAGRRGPGEAMAGTSALKTLDLRVASFLKRTTCLFGFDCARSTRMVLRPGDQRPWSSLLKTRQLEGATTGLPFRVMNRLRS